MEEWKLSLSGFIGSSDSISPLEESSALMSEIGFFGDQHDNTEYDLHMSLREPKGAAEDCRNILYLIKPA